MDQKSSQPLSPIRRQVADALRRHEDCPSDMIEMICGNWRLDFYGSKEKGSSQR